MKYFLEVALDVEVDADSPEQAQAQVQAALRRTFAYMDLSASKPKGYFARVQQVHEGRECPGHVVDVEDMQVGPAQDHKPEWQAAGADEFP